MSPLHCWGSPTPSTGSKIKSGPKPRGTKCDLATSPLPSREPKRGRKSYVTRAFSGIANAKHGEQNQKSSPTQGNKIKSGYLTRAFLGPKNTAEMLRHPCIRGDRQRQARRAKSNVVPNIGEQNLKWLPHPCLLWGPKEGRNATLPVHCSVIPNIGKKNQKWLPHPCLLGGPKGGRNATSPLHCSEIPNIGEKNQKWLPHPCLLGGPKEGGNATSPVHSRGSPTPSTGRNIKSGPQHR